MCVGGGGGGGRGMTIHATDFLSVVQCNIQEIKILSLMVETDAVHLLFAFGTVMIIIIIIITISIIIMIYIYITIIVMMIVIIP